MNYTFEPSKHVIHLSEINDAAFIQRYCKSKKIYFMVYAIKWKAETLKYGIQYKVGSTQPGERLYTQVGWMPGWKTGTLKRCAKTGEAVTKMMQYIEEKYSSAFDKNDVTVEIMDYTGYPFVTPENRYAEMQNFEEYYKKLYFQLNGKYPVGNPKQEKLRFIATNFNNLFYEDD